MPPKTRGKRAAPQAASDGSGRAKKPKKANADGKGRAKAGPIDNDGDSGVASEQENDQPHKKDFKEAQVATAKTEIPIDDTCPLTSYTVYIDADGIIYDASLNQTNSGNNNNKFYRIQLLQGGTDFRTWTRWGRVGELGQSALLGSGPLEDAMKQFQNKFKDKSGLKWEDRGEQPKAKKYVFVERSYEPDSDDEEAEGAEAGASRECSDYSPPKCTLSQPVMSLMELIFNQDFFQATMAALNYDSAKLPLGKLSKATISRGYKALKQLADLLDDDSLAANYEMSVPAAIEHLSNLYYSTIPHDFGRNRPPVVHNQDLLKREIELLESLSDLKDADLIMKKDRTDEDMHVLDSRFKGLGLQEMSPLERKSDEFTGISEYLLKTCGATHSVSYQVTDIFRIQREGEEDRFAKSEYSKIDGDRRLLWHGSRATNFAGILAQGLRIAPPEAPVNGYMFGKGIYLADMSSKSSNYCASYNTGGNALLLLCDVELGNPMQMLQNADYQAGDNAKAKGLHSTWGQGLVGPSKWKDAECLHSSLAGVKIPDTSIAPGNTDVENAYLQYNEYIAYDVSQVRLRYLLRVRM